MKRGSSGNPLRHCVCPPIEALQKNASPQRSSVRVVQHSRADMDSVGWRADSYETDFLGPVVHVQPARSKRLLVGRRLEKNLTAPHLQPNGRPGDRRSLGSYHPSLIEGGRDCACATHLGTNAQPAHPGSCTCTTPRARRQVKLGSSRRWGANFGASQSFAGGEQKIKGARSYAAVGQHAMGMVPAAVRNESESRRTADATKRMSHDAGETSCHF